MDDAERQRRVRPRDRPDPEIRLLRGARPARIDHDQPRAGALAFADPDPVPDMGRFRVVSPDQDRLRGLEVRRRNPGPVAEDRAGVATPLADVRGRHDVGGAERARQPVEPGRPVAGLAAARGRPAEGDGLGAGLGAYLQSPLRDGRVSLLPGDFDPPGVAVGLGARALHGRADPLRAVHQFRRSAGFDAEADVGVAAVGPNADEAALFDRGDGCAFRGAKRAIPAYVHLGAPRDNVY